MEDNKPKKDAELDDFWDIDHLIPQRPETKKQNRTSYDTNTVEIRSEKSTASSNPVRSESLSATEFKRFIPPFTEKDFSEEKKPDFEYERQGSLIHSVKIYNWQTKYAFYERFSEDAKRLWKYRGGESPQVPFFSYSPQYSHMNRDQLSYYLWWRENARHGKYLDADYSYVLLYVYELINLSELLEHGYCLDQLCGIWIAYGEKYPFISKYLAEWVCDFCLIFNLEIPSEKLRRLYPQIMKECTLKEFYASCDPSGSTLSARALIDISGAYDFTKSKYATEDRIPIMKKHLIGALDHVVKRLSEQGRGLFTIGASTLRVIRTSYTGALCSPAIKKKIDVEYNSYGHSYELKYMVSDILKYSENKLRKLWGIKSRLSIYALPNEIKGYVEEYFDKVLLDSRAAGAIGATSKKRAEEMEYEKLYYTPKQPLSLERASSIEDESWDTTKLLVDTFEEEFAIQAEEENEPQIVSNETEIQENESNGLRQALGEKYEFLIAVLEENMSEQRAILARLGVLAEALVDEINEIAYDVIGDILIEDDGEKYTVIDEYKEQITGGSSDE